jgi:hypothetical protein
MNTKVNEGDPVTLGSGRELKLLWVELLQRPWTSLVVVPTADAVSAHDVASVLEETAGLQDLSQVETLDAIGAGAGEGLQLARQMGARVASGKRVVVLVDSLTSSLAGFPVVREAQAALLVLRYGSTMASARATLELVGRSKVLGAVALPPPAIPVARPA